MVLSWRQLWQEVVYPHTRAVELAKETQQHVLSMPNEMAENTNKPAASSSAPSVEAMKKAPVKAIERGGRETELAQVHQPTLPQARPVKELPKTSSLDPLFALAGMFSLATAVGVRILSKRVL
jgi:hypothetical protein